MNIFWFIFALLLGFIVGYCSFMIYIYVKIGFRMKLKFKHKLIIRKYLKYNNGYVTYTSTSDIIRILEAIRKKHNIFNSSIQYRIIPGTSNENDDISVKIRCNKWQLENIKLDIIKYSDNFYILK